MTGFARVRRGASLGEITLSLRAVNHRALDLHFHLPSELEPYESALRKTIAAEVARGHIDVRAQLSRQRGESASEFNAPLLTAWLAAFRKASDEHGLKAEPDLNAAFRLPGMMAEVSAVEPGPDVEAEVVAIAREALVRFNEERTREGAATVAVLRGYAQSIGAKAELIDAIRGEVGAYLHQRLRERLAELLSGAVVDQARLAQEAAMLADRAEIAEEVTRLRIHARQLLDLLQAGGETGKKLEFLLQEMQREANTILSKASGAGEPGRRVTELGLAVKSEVEKLREQSLNLE